MLRSKDDTPPPVSLGLASLALGTIGLALFILPVLGVAIAALGLLVSLAGIARTALGRQDHLRWALGGLCVSAFAVSVGLVVALAPLAEESTRGAPGAGPPDAPRGFVPPPARPRQF